MAHLFTIDRLERLSHILFMVRNFWETGVPPAAASVNLMLASILLPSILLPSEMMDILFLRQ